VPRTGINRRAIDAYGHQVVLIAIVEMSDERAAPVAEAVTMALDMVRKAGCSNLTFYGKRHEYRRRS
jgi:hypothetical protein